MGELNLKSSTIEKSLELAKEFLGKLISPTIEEIGLLISDNIRFIRYKNQIRILLKSKEIVDAKNIKLKELPIKILVPLLENASLEEDEKLQDLWSNMLVNLVDSNLNLQNQIFPYLLSQISIQEFDGLKEMFKLEMEFKEMKAQLELTLKEDVNSSNRENINLVKRVRTIEQEGFLINLEEFELANLQRLGLIRPLPPKIIIEEFSTGNSEVWGSTEEWHQLDAAYNPDDFGFRITDLGIRFLNICEII